MVLTPQQLQEMDQASGLSGSMIEQMDKVAAGSKPGIDVGQTARNVANTVADAAPIAGGILGGFAGAAIGGPAALFSGSAGVIGGMGTGGMVKSRIHSLTGTPLTKEEEFKATVTDPGIAGITDLAFGKAGELASAIGKPIGNALSKTSAGKFVSESGQRLAQKAVSKVANISGKEFADFEVETGGKNIIDTMYSYLQKTDPKKGDELRQLYGKAGKGGILESEMKAAEKVIQEGVKKSGNTPIVSTEVYLQPIRDEIDRLSPGGMATPGQEDVVSGLQKFSDTIQQTYGEKGLTARNLLDAKRAGDSKLGAAVSNEDKGSAMIQAKKIITNQAREVLKKALPDIKEALGIEQEIMHMSPIIKDQIANKAVNKDFISKSLSSFDLSRPGTWTRPITENDWVLRKGAQGKAPIPGLQTLQNAVNNPLLNQGIRRTVPSLTPLVNGEGGGSGKPGLDIPPRYTYR